MKREQLIKIAKEKLKASQPAPESELVKRAKCILKGTPVERTKVSLSKRSSLIKEAGAVATVYGVAKKGVKKVLSPVGDAAKKAGNATLETMNTASGAKRKAFEDSRLGLKNKGKGFFGKKWHKKDNDVKEKLRTKLRKKPAKVQDEFVRAKTDGAGSRKYSRLRKDQNTAKLKLGAGATTAGGAIVVKKNNDAKKQKAHQRAVANYYRNQRGY